MPKAEAHPMQCLEVWGGNHAVDTAVTLPGLNAYVYSRPYQNAEGGGDVHYLSSCATGRIARLLLADVSGHGFEVSDVAVTLRDLMRRHMNYLDQSSFVSTLNREFGSLSEAGCFATSVVLSVWLPTKEIVICSAGHPRALWYDASSRTWGLIDPASLAPPESADPANLPLGIIDPGRYDQARVQMGVGDLLLLYTDSITEAKSPDNRLLGEAGLLRIAEHLNPARPAELIPDLIRRVDAYRQGSPPDDDTTLILLEQIEGAPEPSISGTFSALGRGLIRLRDAVLGDRRGPVRTHRLEGPTPAKEPTFA